MRAGRWVSPVIALSVLVTGCEAGDDPIALRVDHTSAPSGVPKQDSVDPASGVLTRAWSANVRGTLTMNNTRFAFAAGHLLTISSRGVDANATGNGATRWHYYEPGRQVAAHTLTAETIVLRGARAQNEGLRLSTA